MSSKFQLTIRNRLLLLSTISLLTFIFLGVFALIQENHLIMVLKEKDRVALAVNNHMNSDMGHDAIRGDVYKLLGLGSNISETQKIEILNLMKDHEKMLLENIKANIELNVSQEVTKNSEDALAKAIQYANLAKKIVMRSSDKTSSGRTDEEEFDALFSLLEKQLGALDEKIIALNAEKMKAAESASNNFKVIVVWSIIISVILLILLCGWAIRSILSPLKRVQDVTEELNSGNGDLTIRLPEDETEIGKITKPLNGFIAMLHGIIEKIKNANDVIKTASKQISTGSFELSRRTESQASALEQTAASIHEFTATIKQNAENAKLANKLASETCDIANKGGQVVNNVVSTMGAITDSSKKIADIIGVIDEIAFQTNLLALNAAVEAARAGEQGRGFAVVAAEVRNLAQRSAGAAKEIKELIGNSVEKVSSGYALVNQAGETMTEIVESVNRVSGLIQEIAHASNEQSTTIEHVNQAVSHMDSATQQNVAVAEESTAVVKLLETQIDNLSEAVGLFRLDSDFDSRDLKEDNSLLDKLNLSTKRFAQKAKEPNRATEKVAHTNDWKEF